MESQVFSLIGWALAFIILVAYVEKRDQLREALRPKLPPPVVKTKKQESWKKQAQAMSKPVLKVIASNGKRLYDSNVVSVDFRKKSKKGPSNSGPDDVA